MHTVTSVDKSGTQGVETQVRVGKFLVNGQNERLDVDWDEQAQVTPMGGLVFFASYLETSGLLDGLCKSTPFKYTSPNAPKERDVLSTLLLSVLKGHTRYAQINELRADKVCASLLGASKIVSEDSVRRAFQRSKPEKWDQWLSKNERTVWEPLLNEPYVLDIDATVKPLYGHQEGAVKGYNPSKPGRPSHNIHSYFIGSLRIVLGLDVLPGNQHAGKHSLPSLWRLLDQLPRSCWPTLLRGDIGYGGEANLLECEQRGLDYLIKQRITPKVKALISQLECDGSNWMDAGDGWAGSDQELKLSGWSRARRCVILRRPKKQRIEQKELAPHEFEFVQRLETGPDFEYGVLVTNSEWPIETLAQLYRDRADCENVFDEMKNQWGWAGFMTQDLQRCCILVRLIALFYNWWNVFTRLAEPERHMEASTSRPLLLNAVGRIVSGGRRKIIRLTPTHAMAVKIKPILNKIALFMCQLTSTAEQLSRAEIWATILSVAFIKWLKGRKLEPVSEGAQILLPLTEQ